MTCKDIDAFLDSGWRTSSAGFPPGVQLHLNVCERCRRLVDLFGEKTPGAEIPDALRAEIETALRKSMKPVSPLKSPYVFALIFFAIFFSVPLIAILSAGSGGARAMSAWQFVVVAAILLGGGALLAISISRQMFPGSLHRIHPDILIASTVGALLVAVLLLFPWDTGQAFITSGLACWEHGLLFAIPSAIAFWLVLRRGAVLSPALLGSTTGLLAGLVGTAVLHFQCQLAEASHLAAWHIGLPVVCAGGGFLFGKLARHKGPENEGDSSA